MLLFNYYSLLLREAIFSSDVEALKTTMLSFYSTLAGVMAALFVVSGIFLMFRMEAIQSEIDIAIDNFRNWVALRVQMKDSNIDVLKINQEPHSWLPKDVLDHIKAALRIAKKSEHEYTTALTDYFDFINGRLRYQAGIKVFSFIPFLMISYIFLNAIYNLVVIDLLISKYRFNLYEDITSSLSWTLMVVLYLIFFMFIAILGPRSSIINAPK